MHLREGVDTAGTADEDLAVIFGVEVDEAFGLEHTVLEFHSAGEAGFLINGKEALDSRVREIFVGNGSEGHGDADAVVGAKGRSFGFEPFAVHPGLDRIGHEIMLHVSVLFAHHIHVRLKDDSVM